jgi:hypothetical protein
MHGTTKKKKKLKKKKKRGRGKIEPTKCAYRDVSIADMSN